MPSPAAISAEALPLRDIHLPAAIGWWPPAPGWWLLLGLGVLLLAGVWLLRRRHRHTRNRRLALAELEELAQGPTEGQAAALSRLLRRAALCYFPPADCAGLCGEAWLEFLDRPFADRPFSQGVGRFLLDSPYRQNAEMDGPAVIELCRRWLQHLPGDGARARRNR
ncbi:hypothetical protein DSOUD_0143 [Desulfuromonas soudanensis]|uniref:DUF4381 domain-containing protein n=1 Tax=Desulfuromonas soudanensis TaxID=1603606 RepID=A0A0M3QEU9_9BACT|nr:DUF4381 domain-containing protein [Desulfuromonas soudanensis]ALC14943.1 hypothetical protein DSOUD_0143 [Desulfuromonas soudanensis]